MTAQERLLALVNSQMTSRALRLSDVTFGKPKAITPVDGRNTEIYINGIQDSGYTGQHRLVYRRIDLSSVSPVDFYLILPPGASVSSHDLVERLNAAYGLDIDLEDIVLETELGSGYYNLKTVPTSLRWTGNVIVEIYRTTRNIEPMTQSTELGEFSY